MLPIGTDLKLSQGSNLDFMDKVSINSSQPAISPFWKALEDSSGRNVTQDQWENRLKKAYPQIRSLFLAQAIEDSNLPNMMVFESQDYRPDIRRRRDGDPHLDEKDSTILGLNLHAFIKLVARGFNLNEKFAETGFASTWQISELSNLPILLTIQNNDSDFLSVVAQLVVSLNHPFILLAPTSRFFNIKISKLLSRRNAGFFDLATQFAILPDGSLQSHTSGGQLFLPYLPEQREDLSENDASRFFALFRKLKLETKYRKASLHDVFTILVLEKKSQVDAAKDLGCSEGLISERVKAIECKMGYSIKLLRNYASEIRDMNQEKDSRARKLYNGGLERNSDPNDDD